MTLGLCPKCRQTVSSEQSFCPHCGQHLIAKSWKKSQLAGIGTGLIVAFGVLSFFGWYVFSGGEAERGGTEKGCEEQSLAFVYSKQVVKSDLTFPSSAHFPRSPSSGDVTVSNLGKCTHQVVAWVDSNNPLGAKIRTYYTVIMQYRKTTKDWYHLTKYLAFDQSRQALRIKADKLRNSYETNPPAPPKMFSKNKGPRARTDSDAPKLSSAAFKGYLGFAAKSKEGPSDGPTCESYGGQPVVDRHYSVVLHMGRRDAVRTNVIFYGENQYVTFKIESTDFWGNKLTNIALCHFAG